MDTTDKGTVRRRPVRRRTLLRSVPVLATLVAVAACSGVPGLYVVERAGQAAAGPAKFDATTYVDGIWDSKVVPTVTAGAVPADKLLPALRKDQKTASTTYGRQSGSGAPYAFMVKGTGKVTEVDENGAVGTLRVNVPGAGSDINLAIGPAFVGTAIRDVVGLDFSQFTNQLDYADAATALNAKVKNTVVDKIDLRSVKGKKVTFTGAFSVLDPSSVLVTPVTLEVAA